MLKSQSFQRIASNIGWLFFDKIIRVGVGLILNVWIARYLGPDQFGLFNYAIAFVSLFTVISNLGLDTLVVKHLVKRTTNDHDLLYTGFILKLIASILCFLLVAFVSLKLSGDIEAKLILIYSIHFFFLPFDVIDYYLQSQLKSKFVVIIRNTSFIIFAVVKAILILNGRDVFDLMYCMAFELSLSGLLLFLFFVKTNGERLSLNFNASTARLLIIEGIPLMFSGLVIIIYMKIDQVMLGNLVDQKSVGDYSAALRLSEGLYFLPSIIATSLLPRLVSTYQKSRSQYVRELKVFVLGAVLVGTTVCVIIFISSDFLIQEIFGAAYVNSVGILKLHIWSLLFVFIGVASSSFWVLENLQRYLFINTAVGALLNIALNFVLLPSHGAMGAAVATLISYIFVNTVFLVVFKKTRTLLLILIESLTLPLRIIFSGVHRRSVIEKDRRS